MRTSAVAVPDPFDEDLVQDALAAGPRMAVLQRLLAEPSHLADALDRWTGLARTALDAPICLISLLTDAHSHTVSPSALQGGSIPVAHALCRYVVGGDAPLAVEDLAAHELLSRHPAHVDYGISAYAGVPVRAGGETVGALCVLDRQPHAWSERDRVLLEDLAEAVGAALALRLQDRELRRARDVAAAHNRAHELIAADAPLEDTLTTIVDGIERFDPAVRASVLLLDRDAGTLHHAAGTRLAQAYRDAIDGVHIGPDVGSCGRAAALAVEVITPDITAEPRWDAYAELALAHDLRHCWSVPVLDRAGGVLGTFALYGSQPRDPDADVLEFLRDAARLAGIAIERRRAHDRLTHEATHDTLTGLANRHGLTATMGELLDAARARGHRVNVLFVDLDRLKRVNDALGHEAGDEVLRVVGDRLRHVVRAQDVVARFGGDEFVIVPRRPLDERRVEQTARRIMRELERPVLLEGEEPVTVSASIGSVTIDPADTSVREALRRADLAMYEVKRHGGHGYRPYAAAGEKQVTWRLRLEQELRGALERDELRVVYQPIVRVADGGVETVEALLRWDNERLGPVSPADFIPVAEESGLIVPIGEWVVRTACREVAPHPDVRVNVNLSPRQLADPGLDATVRSALRAAKLRPERLALEITETALLRADTQTAQALATLEELGIELVLDDFGTGYSSLATLKEHPVHALKIDRMFVAGLGTDAGDAAIVEAVIGMAHGMARPVTAEGVEHEGHLEILRGLGCDFVQGYLLGRPGPLADALSPAWPV